MIMCDIIAPTNMKFKINLSGKTVLNAMRSCGYAPAYAPSTSLGASAGKPDEFAFHRFLAGRSYPKFHLYCKVSDDKKSALLNLHLDQKQPSYKGTRAHSGEYEGELIEREAARIQQTITKTGESGL